MFDRIAPTYDLLNGLLSAGQHLRWARKMLRAANPQADEKWLDIATGSAVLIEEGLIYQPATKWFGLDPSKQLLLRSRFRKGLTGIPLVLGVGEYLPFPDNYFEGITIAYGLRNHVDPLRGVQEMRRVLKPGGRTHILEFHPSEKGNGWGRGGFVRFYLEKIIPLIGRAISGDAEAYSYLSESAGGFWTRSELAENLRQAGFTVYVQQSYMGKSVTLTIAKKTG